MVEEDMEEEQRLILTYVNIYVYIYICLFAYCCREYKLFF